MGIVSFRTLDVAFSVTAAGKWTWPSWDLTLAAGAPLCTGKARCAETEEGPVAVETLAAGCAVLLLHTLVHVCREKWVLVSPHVPTLLPPVPSGEAEPLTLTDGAVGQLEARGTEALVGAHCVPAHASQAAAPGVFTLVHVCRVTWGGRQP